MKYRIEHFAGDFYEIDLTPRDQFREAPFLWLAAFRLSRQMSKVHGRPFFVSRKRYGYLVFGSADAVRLIRIRKERNDVHVSTSRDS